MVAEKLGLSAKTVKHYMSTLCRTTPLQIVFRRMAGRSGTLAIDGIRQSIDSRIRQLNAAPVVLDHQSGD
jgi:hypothetical protein